MLKFILDDQNNVVPVDNVLDWGQWFEAATANKSRVVAQEQIGDAFVSTVFLGIDHGWNPAGPPIIWETMVFGGAMDGEQDRCPGTWDMAKAMHAEMVAKVKEQCIYHTEDTPSVT
jgi:hypothetical protein